MIVASLENFMNHENVDSRRMDLHRRIALVLRKEPGLVRDSAGPEEYLLVAQKDAEKRSGIIGIL